MRRQADVSDKGAFLGGYHFWLALLLPRRVQPRSWVRAQGGARRGAFPAVRSPNPSLGQTARHWREPLPLPGAPTALNLALLRTHMGQSPSRISNLQKYLQCLLVCHVTKQIHCYCRPASLATPSGKGQPQKGPFLFPDL